MTFGTQDGCGCVDEMLKCLHTNITKVNIVFYNVLYIIIFCCS